MKTHLEKAQANRVSAGRQESQSAVNTTAQKQAATNPTSQLVDNRPEALQARELQQLANNNNSPQARQAVQLQGMADNYAVRQQLPLRETDMMPPGAWQEDKTKLPQNLIDGAKAHLGVDISNTEVNLNSSKPAQPGAHAIAEGNRIDVASGQEKYLAHEAVHVAQQHKGQVKPTGQVNGVDINDDPALEKEADVMGEKINKTSTESTFEKTEKRLKDSPSYRDVTQRVIINAGKESFDQLVNTTPTMGLAVFLMLDVAVERDVAGGRIVEKRDKDKLKELGKNENIYIIGHGEIGFIGGSHPGEIAELLTPKIPEDWEGQIYIISCNAGFLANGRSRSGAGSLHEKLNENVKINSFKGATLTHKKIKNKIRVTLGDRTQFEFYYKKSIPWTIDEKKSLLKHFRIDQTKNTKEIDSCNDDEVNSRFEENMDEYLSGAQGSIAQIDNTLNEKIKSTNFTKEREIDSLALNELASKATIDWLNYIKQNLKDLSDEKLKEIAKKASDICETLYLKCEIYGEKYKLFIDDMSEFHDKKLPENRNNTGFKSFISKLVRIGSKNKNLS